MYNPNIAIVRRWELTQFDRAAASIEGSLFDNFPHQQRCHFLNVPLQDPSAGAPVPHYNP